MERNDFVGVCGCCGCEIFKDEYFTKIDGVLHCDYCAGEGGLTASELAEMGEQEKGQK